MKLQLKTLSAELNYGNRLQVPYWELESGAPGPKVLMTAAFHGNELQGIEVIRRFAAFATENLLKGSCLFLPLGNPLALRKRHPHAEYVFGRDYGGDAAHNLNCCWPGNPAGTDTQRLVYALNAELAARADYALDLHCWEGRHAAAALIRDGNADAEAFVRVCGLPFARRSKKPPETPTYTLTTMFYNSGRSAICVEFSGQDTFVEAEISRGVRAVRNMFRHLGMLPGEMEKAERETLWLDDDAKNEVKSPAEGIFMETGPRPGDDVEAGDKLGDILRADTLELVEVRAPVSGRLFILGPIAESKTINPAQWRHPYVDKGQPCANIIVRR